MQLAEVVNQKLDYLGSIDDKVVQYQAIKNPEQQLLRSLFFSAITGDPIVLNDGYLLHSRWGRKQLTDSQSTVRKLNQQRHLLLLARSPKSYSIWIQEQAEKTKSYRDLFGQLGPEELELLDEAWSGCVGTSWPTLDLQKTMLNLLNSNSAEVLHQEISPTKLHQHRRLFDVRIANGETVRAAWESAMLEITAFSEHEKSIMMEFANEVYHASFACGFAGRTQGVDVGIAGYGRQRLSHRGAYQQEDGESLAQLLNSKQYRQSKDTIRKLATVFVSRDEKQLFSGEGLVKFLVEAESAKALYRSSLQALLRSPQPTHELTGALEQALEEYAKIVYGHFGVHHNQTEKAMLRVLDLVDVTTTKLSEQKNTLAVASNLIGLISPHLPIAAGNLAGLVGKYGEDTLEYLNLGVPIVTNTYQFLQSKRRQELSLLPQFDRTGYALALDSKFVGDATNGIPSFAPAS